MQAVAALGALRDIASAVYEDRPLTEQAQTLRREVHAGIQRHGIIQNDLGERMYAFEVDGLGHAIAMDDANFGLLSAPYFGFTGVDDPVYQATRRFVLSDRNPHYCTGSVGSGIGSQHTTKGWIWPLGLDIEGLTTNDPAEHARILNLLLASDRGDHGFPESFDCNNVENFSREDFGMPHGLFVEFYRTKLLGRPALPMPDTRDLTSPAA